MPPLHSSFRYRATFYLVVTTALLLLHLSYTLAEDVLLPQAKRNNVEIEEISKRELHVREQMALQAPIAVRKMTGDQGEKFFLDYWEFGSLNTNEKGPESSEAAIRFPLDMDTENEAHANNANVTSLQREDATSSTQESNPAYLPAIAIHRDRWFWMENLVARSLLGKRQFQCPQGTNDCSGINRPDNCCATGEECVILEDSGIGDVGCCPEGASCAGGVSECDEDAGFSDCPNSPNGGCCIPGYRCQDEGCVIVDTLVVVATPTVRASTTSTRSASTTTTSPSSSTTPSSTSTRRTTPSSTSSTTTSSSSSSSISVTVTTTAAAPLRPTAATSPPSDFCPTGFYACSAIYHGGCCQIDRNCDSTSCPPPPSNTVVDANGVTILASDGVGVDNAFPTGECASGWVECGADDGFGCCPSGFECGESCVVRVTETGSGNDGDGDDDDVEVVAETVAKIGPENGAEPIRYLSGMFSSLTLTVSVGAGWVLLMLTVLV